MNIALAGFMLESASLLPHQTTYEAFERSALRGAELIESQRGTNTGLGGFISVCEAAGAGMQPLVFAWGGAAGCASDDAFERYTREIVQGLAKLKTDLDGVLLYLHGAMVTPTRLDPELELLREVRKAVGATMPVVVALDYHGNLDAAILEPATAVFGYQSSPHVDMAATGQRAAHCMIEILAGRLKPVSRLSKPGLMVPSIFSATALEPLAEIMAAARRMESTAASYLDISVFAGFSYGDVPNCGFSIVAVTHDDQALAQSVVDTLTATVRQNRKALYRPLPVHSVEAGVALAMEKARTASRPIVLLEHADRLNDSTHGLRELLRRDARKIAVPYLWDPAAAAEATKVGVGAPIRLPVGGHSSTEAGGAVVVEGIVRFAGEKTYRISGPMMHGKLIRLGLSALIELANWWISLTTHPATAVDEDPFLQFGLRAMDCGIILLRSKTHFRAVYEELAQEILIIDTPDWGCADLTSIPYRQITRKGVYPFDEAD